MSTAADDLDDGLVYDFDGSDADVDETVNTLEIEESSESIPAATKRRLDDEVDTNKTVSKRQKKLQKSKLHTKKREQAEYEIQKKKKLAKSSNDDIVEFFATKIRELNPELSALELNDLYFKKNDFISTQKFEDDRNLVNFSKFIQNFSKSPKAIIFSMSNMRVADISRSLSYQQEDTKTNDKAKKSLHLSNSIKLFAKNKLKDDLIKIEQIFDEKKPVKKLQNIKYFIATPMRMEKVLEKSDAFFKGKDKLDIILDASYLDPKENTLLSCETTEALCKILKKILENKSSVKILLY